MEILESNTYHVQIPKPPEPPSHSSILVNGQEAGVSSQIGDSESVEISFEEWARGLLMPDHSEEVVGFWGFALKEFLKPGSLTVEIICVLIITVIIIITYVVYVEERVFVNNMNIVV